MRLSSTDGAGPRLNGAAHLPLIARTGKLTANGPQGVLHTDRVWPKMRGVGRAPTRTSRQWRSCRVRRPFGQLYTKGCRVCASYRRRGYQGGLRGETASIAASFDFHPLKTRELSQIPARCHFGTSPHLEGGHLRGSQVAVGLGCPWDPSGRRRPVRVNRKSTNLASGPVSTDRDPPLRKLG